MNWAKKQVREELLHIIKDVGELKGCYLIFNLNKLLRKWEDSHTGKFTDLGLGKLTVFLKQECFVESIGEKEFRIPTQTLCNETENADVHQHQQQVGSGSGKSPDGERCFVEQLAKDRPKAEDTCSQRLFDSLGDLKLEVLIVCQQFMLNKKKGLKREFVTVEELNQEWRGKHPGKFRDYGFGCFKAFLENHCNFKRPSDWNVQNQFCISLLDIERELKNIEETKCKDATITVGGHASLQDTPALALAVVANNSCVVRDIPHHITETDKVGQGNPPSPAKATDIAMQDVAAVATQRTDISASGSEPMESVQNRIASLEHRHSQSEKYFLQVVTILYKCGLEGFRLLFKKIHPKWQNTKEDLKGFDKGQLKLDLHEKRKFHTGDIDQWDITLMAKVLLYTTVACSKLKNNPSVEDAVKKIRETKNEILSHHKSMELTKSEYERIMKQLEQAVLPIGISKSKFKTTLEYADLNKDNLYFKMYLEEQARCNEELKFNQQAIKADISNVRKELKETNDVGKETNDVVKNILEKITYGEIKQSEIPSHVKKQPQVDWDEWLKIRNWLKNLDTDNNQYLLITDKMQISDEDHVKIIANVPWKLVLDLDPDSDINGFLTRFTPGETKGGVIVTHTPSQLMDANTDSLVDEKRMQWLFVNGRNVESSMAHQQELELSNEDKPKESLREWKKNFKIPIQDFIKSCCESLDRMKPTFCIVLNIRSGVSIQIVQDIICEIDGRFVQKKFSMSYVSFAPELDIGDLSVAMFTNLPQRIFLVGLSTLLGSSSHKYELPSGQAGLKQPLAPRIYNYLTEYLEILYLRCEDIANELSEEEKKAFENEHLKKFITGNAISFPSLYFQHDAKRKVTSKLCIRIATSAAKYQRSQIVQITHAPGSGGTTIARRALWDLHDTIPCAIVKTEFAPESFGSDSDGEKYLDSLCERITVLEETCDTCPVILVDGSSRLVRLLSDCIVRKLEGKAIILRCANYRESTEVNDSYFHSENQFDVNPKLNEDEDDYAQFKLKYNDYCKRFQRPDKTETRTSRDRVFHFPMMAMLGEFNKLDEIVKDSLNILKEYWPVEYEIAILVAFLQRYSSFPTPASFIAKYFNKHCQTYEDVAGNFSETLMNLMVPEKAPTRAKFIGSRVSVSSCSDDDDEDDDDGDDDFIEEGTRVKRNLKRIIQSYSFQHQVVADLVFQHSNRSLDQITQDFVNTEVLKSYRGKNDIKPLINSLFLYNKEHSEEHFSLLVQELAKIPNGGRIFEEAAKQTKDVTFHSHVARFFANKKKFKKARELIKEGFEAEANAPVEKKRGVLNTEGYIVLTEMKSKKEKMITSIELLKSCSVVALDLFRKARDNPPRIFPNPLLGEVTVWQFCFEWIIKDMHADVEGAVKFILADKFFMGSISECLCLLDEVDQMVLTVPTLNDPSYTRKLANERRLTLIQTLGRTMSKGKRKTYRALNIQRMCQEIISNYMGTASEKEIFRLRVLWLMDQADKKLHLLVDLERENLYIWLRKLVKDYKMWVHTRELMDAAAIQRRAPFEIDEALSIVDKWQKNLPSDPFSLFYRYILCFLSVCNGHVFDYRATYEAAKEECARRTVGNPKRHLQQYFIGSEGEKGSICTVVSRSVLESKYVEDTKRKSDKTETRGETRRYEDPLDAVFWEKHCREYLLECRGRIYLSSPATSRGRKTPYILMEPGSLRVGVPKNAVGTPNLDYRPDSRVSFVICFTLAGPKARGIRFVDDRESKGIHGAFKRQGSQNGKSKK